MLMDKIRLMTFARERIEVDADAGVRSQVPLLPSRPRHRMDKHRTCLSLIVDLKHNPRGGLVVLIEHALQHANHKLHWRVVVIQEPHFGQ
jgi:hypothetical protein